MPYPQVEVILKYKGRGKEPVPILDSVGKAYDVIRKICNKNTILWTEEALMLCLNNSNGLLNWFSVSRGGIGNVTMDIRVIATVALKCTASRIILAHNHPGGVLYPSIADIELTREIITGLSLLRIELLDHMIFNDREYLSMATMGYF
jgi:DNA repair protein RadC